MNQDTKNWIANMDKNFNAMVAEDKDAKKKKQLVGRYISQPFADGRAYYKIIKENKKTVRMEVVTDIGDDWVLPYWGETPTIDKQFAIDTIEGREALEKIFS
jgi:hypothetical protein